LLVFAFFCGILAGVALAAAYVSLIFVAIPGGTVHPAPGQKMALVAVIVFHVASLGALLVFGYRKITGGAAALGIFVFTTACVAALPVGACDLIFGPNVARTLGPMPEELADVRAASGAANPSRGLATSSAKFARP
jgi:hypothetical protein